MKTSKIVFMGNTGVGKSCLINSFMENRNSNHERIKKTTTMMDYIKVVEARDSNE